MRVLNTVFGIAAAATLCCAISAGAAEVRLAGSISNLLDETSIARAKIKSPGNGSTRSTADGDYSLDFDCDAFPCELFVKKRGYHRRVLWIDEPGEIDLDIDLISKSGGFSLEHFNVLFRLFHRTHPGYAEGGDTTRWVTDPKFVLYNRYRKCANGDCSYTGAKVSAPVLQQVRAWVTTAAPLLTGGVATGRRFTVRSSSKPTGPGEITIGLDPDLGVGGAAAATRDAQGRLLQGAFVVKARSDGTTGEYVVKHELAHTLGFHHPFSYWRFARPTVMGASCGANDRAQLPTADDVLHGFVAYSRPPGSRSPDTDPRPAAAPSGGLSVIHWVDPDLELAAPAGATPAFAGRAATEDLEGKIGPDDPGCGDSSANRPCARHRFDADRSGRVTIDLSWTRSSTDLDFELWRMRGNQETFVGRSYYSNRCTSTQRRQIDDFSVEKGEHELRVIRWSGAGKTAERYTATVHLP